MKCQPYLPSQCTPTYIYRNKLLDGILAAFTQGVFTRPLYMYMHTIEQWLPYSNTNVLHKTNTEQDIGTSNLNSKRQVLDETSFKHGDVTCLYLMGGLLHSLTILQVFL